MNSETAVRGSWLGRTRISAKLVAIVAVFVTVICAVTGLFVLAYNVGVGVRAYVGGEGMWSKGQKDAVYSLSRYLGTGDERDYRNYQTAIALPLGDRDARLEMEKPEFEQRRVLAGFAQGGNSAEDIPYMIFLFRHFKEMPYFSQAITVWREAERELLQLPLLADEARLRMAAGPLAATERTVFLDRVQAINARVTPLEQQFSQLLAAGAREVQALLLKVTLATTAALIAIGVLFAWSISRDLRASITGLREGAMRVARGDLTAPITRRSQDELGELATVFNDMMAARREAETALITANEFRERVMESATNAIYTMDMEGRFTTANRRTAEITGYPIEDLIGQTWANMVREEDLPELYAGYVSTVSGSTPITNREISLRQKNGHWVVIVFSIAPLRREGVIFGVVGAAEDITERKHAEAELKARAEELSRSNQELEQFAYVASHDLQEPLRTVTGFAQLLGRRYQGRLDAEADEFIGFITSGVVRMKSLIEDLLAYSRVQREHHAAGVVALDAVLATALANLGAAIQATGATVTHTSLPELAVDPRQFAQLFQNLIGNAIKFRGEAAPLVHLSAEAREADWLFSISDNGIGIDAQSAGRVFMLFQRLHSRDQYEGNGIGLTICKKIVELHGGRIWVEPTPAGASGTVFRFTLPKAA
ncbi:MAG: ATP-binding protein [Pseudomonadota bacterium]